MHYWQRLVFSLRAHLTGASRTSSRAWIKGSENICHRRKCTVHADAQRRATRKSTPATRRRRTLGALLSDGIDSRLTVRYMAEISATPLKTFSMRFAEVGYDKPSAALTFARAFDTEHRTLDAPSIYARRAACCPPGRHL